MKIEYNKPVEVTEEQYKYLTREFAGIIAHNKKEGKYYIYVWIMKYAGMVEEYLEKTSSLKNC